MGLTMGQRQAVTKAAAARRRRASEAGKFAGHDKTMKDDTTADLSPAAVRRQIQALTSELLDPDHQRGFSLQQASHPGSHRARIRSWVN